MISGFLQQHIAYLIESIKQNTWMLSLVNMIGMNFNCLVKFEWLWLLQGNVQKLLFLCLLFRVKNGAIQHWHYVFKSWQND